MSRSLTVKPDLGQMIKPHELIELKGAGPLTLHDRRVFNLLVQNAFGPQLAEPSKVFTIPTSALREQGEPMTRLVDSVERLMTTLVVARHPDGAETRMQLLSTNTIKTTANSGTLTYCFPPKLAELVRESNIFAKLDIAVMKSFGSKYAFSLYEAISRRIGMKHVFTEKFSIGEMRDLLGVEDGKLVPYKNLKSKAVDAAFNEVNEIAPFSVNFETINEGRKVVGFVVSWAMKDLQGQKEAYAKLNKPRIVTQKSLNKPRKAPENLDHTVSQ